MNQLGAFGLACISPGHGRNTGHTTTRTHAMSNSDNAAHLFCYGCRANPSLAKLDAGKAFVCHCTHVDGEISPVPYGNLDDKPERWKFVAPPDRPVNNRKTLCAKTGCEKTTATGQIFCDKHLESGCSRTGRTNE